MIDPSLVEKFEAVAWGQRGDPESAMSGREYWKSLATDPGDYGQSGNFSAQTEKPDVGVAELPSLDLGEQPDKQSQLKWSARYRGTPTENSYRYYWPPELPDFEQVYQSKDFPHVFLGSSEWEDLEQAAKIAGIHPENFLRFDVADHETPRSLPVAYYSTGLQESQLFYSPDDEPRNPQVDLNEIDYGEAQERFNNAADTLAETIVSTSRPIYVHCVMGSNRSVGVLAAALTKLTDRSLLDVLKEMKASRREVGVSDAYFMMALQYSKNDEDEWKEEMGRRLDVDYNPDILVREKTKTTTPETTTPLPVSASQKKMREKTNVRTAQVEGLRNPGDRLWFEYHCLESHDSGDAELWYRSHQQVTIVGLAPNDAYYPPNGLTQPSTIEERADWAAPIVYKVRFDDGFEGDATEDELLDDPNEFFRPDPPPPRFGFHLREKTNVTFGNNKWSLTFAQSKPMPLPGTIPFGARDNHRGIERIDKHMTDDTADQENQKGVQYLDAGYYGVAYDMPNGNVIKYCLEKDEADTARWLMQNPLPSHVRVFSVTGLQDGSIYAIETEKVRGLSHNESVMFDRYIAILSAERQSAVTGVDPYTSSAYIKEENPKYKSFFDAVDRLWHLLETGPIHTFDIYHKNVGWRGRDLVVLDLGSHEFRKKQAVAQSKSMPLPVKTPEPIVDLPPGAYTIDYYMDQETADKERELGAKYYDAGGRGLATELPNGNVVKYTNDPDEAKTARYLIEHPEPYFVQIYSVRQLKGGKLFAIEMEKVQTLDAQERQLIEVYRRNQSPKVRAENPEYAELFDAFDRLKTNLLGSPIRSLDVFCRNMGWRDGELVMFDFGLSRVGSVGSTRWTYRFAAITDVIFFLMNGQLNVRNQSVPVAADSHQWSYRFAQASVSIDLGDYPQQVEQYLTNIAHRAEDQRQSLQGYQPDLSQIRADLEAVGYANPDQAIQTLESGDDLAIFRIYSELSNLAVSMDRGDPRMDILHRIKPEIRKISDMNDKYSFTVEDAQQHAVSVVQRTKRNMELIQAKVSEAISSIPDWYGTPVVVHVGTPSSDFSFSEPNYGDPVTTAEVIVGQQTAWGGAASFTLFADFDEQSGALMKIEVDDILEGGDTDFFTDQKIQSDYFSLVSELKNPGRTSQELDKVVTLYTARPVEHRQQYLDAQSIPPNIFMTSTYDNAAGLARDYGKRDVWKIRIRNRYLLQTMDGSGVRWYQVKPQDGLVPVESISLIDPWEDERTASGNWSLKYAASIEVVENVGYGDPNDDFFYHVTTTNRLPEILRQGLHPNKAHTIRGGFYEGYSRGKLFFCERENAAWWRDRVEEHLFHSQDDPPDTVIVRFPKYIVQGIESDEIGTKDSNAPSYYTTTPIVDQSENQMGEIQ